MPCHSPNHFAHSVYIAIPIATSTTTIICRQLWLNMMQNAQISFQPLPFTPPPPPIPALPREHKSKSRQEGQEGRCIIYVYISKSLYGSIRAKKKRENVSSRHAPHTPPPLLSYIYIYIYDRIYIYIGRLFGLGKFIKGGPGSHLCVQNGSYVEETILSLLSACLPRWKKSSGYNGALTIPKQDYTTHYTCHTVIVTLS